ncbi:UNVERIFIED_CONTAM: hypothetical protein FKN15_001968 [Acipenser sinensis]
MMGIGGDDDKMENGAAGGGGFFESFKRVIRSRSQSMDAMGLSNKKQNTVCTSHSGSFTHSAPETPKTPGISLIIPGKSPTRKKSGPFSSRRSSAIGIENIQEVQERRVFDGLTLFDPSRECSPSIQRTTDSGHKSQEPKSDSSNQSSPEMPTTKNRAASIPEANDLSRSSSNASSFASVVEENEVLEEYDTGMESLSSAGTPHKRDSFTYSPWLEDSISSASAASGGNSPVPLRCPQPDSGKPAEPSRPEIRIKLEKPHEQTSSHSHKKHKIKELRRARMFAMTDDDCQPPGF